MWFFKSLGGHMARCFYLSMLSFLSLALGGIFTAFPAGAQSSELRDINSYVLFAFESLALKGRNGPDGGNVIGGNIGVNEVSSDPNQIEANFGDPVFMSDGTAVVVPEIRIAPGSSIWDLYTNKTVGAFDRSVVKNSGPTPFEFPILHSQPEFPTFTPGSSALVVRERESLPLAPGSYGVLSLRDGSTLTLANGIYNFASIHTGKSVTINVSANTEVRIAQRFLMNNNARIIGADTASFYIRGDGVSRSDPVLNFSKYTEAHGQFYAPTGNVRLGHSTDLFGRFWAARFSSDFNVNITYRAPERVRGRFFDDANCDGKQESTEAGLAGITVYLDCNSNNAFDGNERSTVTNSNGAFSFERVTAGTCIVRPIVPSGKQCSFPAPNCAYTITLADAGKLHDGNVFGLSTPSSPVCAPTVSTDRVSGSAVGTPYCGSGSNANTPLSGVKIYLDCNNNGVFDASEPSSLTDSSGNWFITDPPVGACTVRPTGVKGFTCTVPSGGCSYSVVIGNTGALRSGYNFVFQPENDASCDVGECTLETHIQSSMGIDAHGYRLFRLSRHAVSLAQQLAKKQGKKLNKSRVDKFLATANFNFTTLWSLAFNAFPTTTYQCTGAASLSCEEKFTADTQREILRVADALVADIKKMLGKKGLKTQVGQKIYRKALVEREGVLKITQTFPARYYVCDKQ